MKRIKEDKLKKITTISCATIQIVLIAFVVCLISSYSNEGAGYQKQEVLQVIRDIHDGSKIVKKTRVLDQSENYTKYTFKDSQGMRFSVITGEETTLDADNQWDGETYNKFILDGYLEAYIGQAKGQNEIKEIISEYDGLQTSEDSGTIISIQTDNKDTFNSLCGEFKNKFEHLVAENTEYNYGINCNFMIIYRNENETILTPLVELLNKK